MGNNWEYWVKEAEKQEKKHKDLHKYYEGLEIEYNNLKKNSNYLEKYCDSLSDHCNCCCKSRLTNNYQNCIEQMEDKIASLTKQRDNYKNDYEYTEKCFQAEREARYKLEDEIKVLKGKKNYPCISLECNDITGESSSLYFCFSYDEKVLLANKVPKYIDKNLFEIHISVDKLGLTYHISCPSYLDEKGNPFIYFKVLHDTKQLIDFRPLEWMDYCNNKGNKDIEDKKFQKYCFLGIYNCLNVCLSETYFIMIDRNPELWIQKSDSWKILYDDTTREGLVQIYDETSLKVVTYYIEGNKVKKVIGEQIVE